MSDLVDFARNLAGVTKRFVTAQLEERDRRLADLEARLEQLQREVVEAKSAAGHVQYCGVYQVGLTYQQGDFVTWGGQCGRAGRTAHQQAGAV